MLLQRINGLFLVRDDKPRAPPSSSLTPRFLEVTGVQKKALSEWKEITSSGVLRACGTTRDVKDAHLAH